MSSEVCPYCGKTYKRLRSHLPHCKASPSSKTPAIKHEANQTVSSSQEGAALGKKSTPTLSKTASPQSKKSKKASVVSSEPETLLKTANASSSTESLTLNPASPPTTKKKKLKLSEQIRAANITSSSPSSSPSIHVPKNQSLPNLIEAEKSKRVTKGARSDSEDLPVDPPSPKATLQTKTKTNPEKDHDPSLFAMNTNPKDSTKVKASKKMAAQTIPATKDTSDSARPDPFKEEVEDLSVNTMFLKSGSGHRGRITLQNAKAMLGRGGSSVTRQSSKPSILSQIEATEGQRSKIRPGTRLDRDPSQENVDVNCVASKTVSNRLPSTSLQNTDLQILQSKPVSLIPVKHDGSPASSLVSVHQSPQGGTLGISEGLKAGFVAVSPSLTRLPSPHLLPIMQQQLPARVEASRSGGGVMVERSRLDVRTQNTADTGAESDLMQQRLGQVRLRKLPEWLAYRTPTHPRDVAKMVQRGWQWYYKRYIDVKKGGVGGVGMLLAGYCVLSYIWSYPHLKLERWRKYH